MRGQGSDVFSTRTKSSKRILEQPIPKCLLHKRQRTLTSPSSSSSSSSTTTTTASTATSSTSSSPAPLASASTSRGLSQGVVAPLHSLPSLTRTLIASKPQMSKPKSPPSPPAPEEKNSTANITAISGPPSVPSPPAPALEPPLPPPPTVPTPQPAQGVSAQSPSFLASLAKPIRSIFTPVLQLFAPPDLPSTTFESSSLSTSSSTGSSLGASSPPSPGVGTMAPQRNSAVLDPEEIDPYVFIYNLPALDDVAGRRCGGILGPQPSGVAGRPTLVLDLDETLVHCSVESLVDPDMVFPVLSEGTAYEVFLKKRPHLDAFLAHVSSRFEVVVFTASQEVYATTLLDLLDPQGVLIHHRLFRDACIEVHGNFLKDLSILGRDLSRVALVDNSPQAYGYQLDNGIPIPSWYDDPSDASLVALLPFLDTLAEAPDVRPLIRTTFNSATVVDALGRAAQVYDHQHPLIQTQPSEARPDATRW